tara:strand:- start:13716 stop:14036 length:321 start_codon:yes stop_codon:yes gene_type:complete
MIRLQNIKELIEDMDKCHQIEILKIFINNSTVVSENTNGTFVNLSLLDENILILLENYIKFVNKQDNQLLNIENEKADIKKEFFKQNKRNIKAKCNKDNLNVILDE